MHPCRRLRSATHHVCVRCRGVQAGTRFCYQTPRTSISRVSASPSPVPLIRRVAPLVRGLADGPSRCVQLLPDLYAGRLLSGPGPITGPNVVQRHGRPSPTDLDGDGDDDGKPDGLTAHSTFAPHLRDAFLRPRHHRRLSEAVWSRKVPPCLPSRQRAVRFLSNIMLTGLLALRPNLGDIFSRDRKIVTLPPRPSSGKLHLIRQKHFSSSI